MSKKNNNEHMRHPFVPSALSDKQRRYVGRIIEQTSGPDIEERLIALRSEARKFAQLADQGEKTENLKLAVTFSVLADLVGQRWIVEAEKRQVYVQAASFEPAEGETIDHAKRRIRKGLQVGSNLQLASPSVQEFIRSMERVRDFNGRAVSIATVIDNGAELAKELQTLNSVEANDWNAKLEGVIRPTLQECATDARCEETGYKLQDIWRYFRYTWSLEYNPLPGRTQRFLIRNAARKSKPVIGIAMLASPTANLGSRDEWIGWQLDQLIDGLMNANVDPRYAAKQLVEALKLSIRQIRSDDLLSSDDLARPDFSTLLRLEQIAAQATAQRKNDLTSKPSNGALVDIRDVAKSNRSDIDWLALSGTSLFRKKRAEQLAPILRSLSVLQEYGIDKEPSAALYIALTEKKGQSAIRIALNEIKKRHLSSEIADLAVCGAIAPYNKIIGGKLIALIMASREARKFYMDRYEGQVSEIASQIAGRAVSKNADLKLITTTSLYGVGSNQYTRLALRQSSFPQLATDVVWQKLRKGQGVSITHISDETVNLMRSLGLAVYGRRRINSVFGEGSSPRMRQIREGLNLIGINDDSLLKQSHGRKVYGCELYEGARRDVLGLTPTGRRKPSASVRQISLAWARRWLKPRLEKQSVLNDLAQTGSHEVQKELRDRISQGDKLREAQPSENGDDARASVASISPIIEPNSSDDASIDLIAAKAASSA